MSSNAQFPGSDILKFRQKLPKKTEKKPVNARDKFVAKAYESKTVAKPVVSVRGKLCR